MEFGGWIRIGGINIELYTYGWYTITILDGIKEELWSAGGKEMEREGDEFPKHKHWGSPKFSHQECKEELSKEIKKEWQLGRRKTRVYEDLEALSLLPSPTCWTRKM